MIYQGRPYSFATTSHFVLVLAIGFTIVLASTLLGFIKHGLEFFSLFVPAGTPLNLVALLVLIETVSYIARPLSLGLRLSANILSGHLLLSILIGFSYQIMFLGSAVYFLLSLFPLSFIIVFSYLELGIVFIQSIVFVILSSTYIKDGLSLYSDIEETHK